MLRSGKELYGIKGHVKKFQSVLGRHSANAFQACQDMSGAKACQYVPGVRVYQCVSRSFKETKGSTKLKCKELNT